MKDRDKELEDNDVYRRKFWHESLYLINKNLSNMLGCISELEKIVNQMVTSKIMYKAKFGGVYIVQKGKVEYE